MGNRGVRLALCALLGMLLGCARPYQDDKPSFPGISAGAGGLGYDIEYIEPQRFQDPGDRTRVFFPVKFVCGETTTNDRLVPATYRTVINVLNLSKFQVPIQWQFSLHAGRGIPGVAAELSSYGSLRIDCDYILRSLANVGVAVSPFIEGFVLIEDLTFAPTVRVVAVQSALHKQLHELSDLVPVDVNSDGHFCKVTEGRLIVTIKNQGEKPAPPSTTWIAFHGYSAVNRSTGALAPGEQVSLEAIDLPAREGTFVFTITADIQNQVRESNDTNNIVIGSCQIIG